MTDVSKQQTLQKLLCWLFVPALPVYRQRSLYGSVCQQLCDTALLSMVELWPNTSSLVMQMELLQSQRVMCRAYCNMPS